MRRRGPRPDAALPRPARGRPGRRDHDGAGRRARLVLLRRLRRPRSARCAARTRCSGGCCATRCALGATVYDLRGITDTLDEDDPHFGLIQFKVGTGGEAVEYLGEWDLPLNKAAAQGVRHLHEPGAGDAGHDVHPVRRHRALARAPAATVAATPGHRAGQQGQRLRLRQRAGWPRRPRGSASTRSRSAPSRGRAVKDAFAGDVLVLTPSVPRGRPLPDRAGRATVAHVESAARAAGGARVVVEAMTSMHRHGLGDADLPALPRRLDDVRLEGFAFHLPLDRHGGYDPVAEVADWLRRLAAAGCRPSVDVRQPPDGRRAGRAAPRTSRRTTFRPRIGTALWLGDRGALQARGTVLDVHRLARGDALRLPAAAGAAGQPPRRGQRRDRARRGLEAPRTVRGPVGRSKASPSARSRRPTCRCRRSGGPASSAGSPSRRTCRCRCCCCPRPSSPPRSATELDCDVRLTTLHPDHVRPLPLTRPQSTT